MWQLPSACVDLVFADLPRNLGKDFGNNLDRRVPCIENGKPKDWEEPGVDTTLKKIAQVGVIRPQIVGKEETTSRQRRVIMVMNHTKDVGE
jgi:DNA modification methylase